MQDHSPRPFAPGWYVTRARGSEHYTRTMIAGVLWALDIEAQYCERAERAARSQADAA